MQEYTNSTYGDSIADRYDSWFPHVDPQMIDRLVELSAGGKALELGIGTGRVALPLRERGVDVHGIDSSPLMVERLRGKPGGGDIPLTIGTFSAFDATERFQLIFVAFNTMYALLTQEEQLSCFRSVAHALTPNGRFLVEAFVPDLLRFSKGQTVRAFDVSDGHVRLECSLHDQCSQTVTSQIVQVSEGGVTLYPVRIRYAWPSELDLMARIAGLTLLDRWGGWKKEPFTNESGVHISVYGAQKGA